MKTAKAISSTPAGGRRVARDRAATAHGTLGAIKALATMRGWRRSGAWAGLFGALVFCSGCNSAGRRSGRGAAAAESPAPPTAHEPCPVESATERFDADGDGRAEIATVRRGGRPVCQAIDLNHDGVADLWTYYDEGGRMRRREYAYGRDSAITEVRLYRAGVLIEIRQATTLAGHIDTWHYVVDQRVARSERDSDGDGRIDEWWEYPDPARPDCPTMYADANGDGRRDQKAGVDLCAVGYVPPARDEFRYRSPDFQRPDSLPTEVDQRAEPSEDGGPRAQ